MTPRKLFIQKFGSICRQLQGNGVSPGRSFSSPLNESVVKVAVIGDPNAGKSTLVNHILGRRVNSISSKVHTTRRKTLAVLNVESTQLVFVDTPGFVSHRSRITHSVEKSLIVDAYDSVEEVDVVLAVHDVSRYSRKYEFSREITKALKLIPEGVSSSLVLNKVDLIRDKSQLLDITKRLVKPPAILRRRKKQMHEMFDAADSDIASDLPKPGELEKNAAAYRHAFDGVFMVSAKMGTGIQSLKEHLLRCAKHRPWLYDGGFVTDQSLEEIIRMCVKEKILDLCSEEIPYVVQPSTLMGPKGSVIRDVAIAAEQSLHEALAKPVVLRLVLKQRRKASG
ncbi:GTPase Era, mitochondrial-like isoform X2 [Watersipora subatra]|uniref:GTPase Era, mitochondrial-like isoform X2 n=1 Tax=Watersipora subatra TaxID=2589382 RepID=UPI00355B1F0E